MSMPLENTLLLDDPTSQRMVLVWPLVPEELRNGSRSDLVAAWAHLSQSHLHEVERRIGALIGLGIVDPIRGTVSDEALRHVRRHAIARIVQLERDAALITQAFIANLGSGKRVREWLSANVPEIDL